MGQQVIVEELPYIPPYQWEGMLDFLAMRAIPGVEAVRDNSYWRAVRLSIDDATYATGWIQVENVPEHNALKLTASDSLAPVMEQVRERVSCLFDLSCDPQQVAKELASMSEVHPALPLPGMRVPGCFDPFETACRAVLGQQITVKAASTLAERMVASLGEPIDTGIEGLTHAFPSADKIAGIDGRIEDALGPLGIIAARARVILAIAQGMTASEISLTPASDAEEQMTRLLAIKGIGPWTAQYVAMRTMGWPDSFLETDIGVKEALPGTTPKERVTIAEKWRPWRSYAVLNLWTSLSL